MTNRISGGVVHTVPHDVRAALIESKTMRDIWNGLTPLARNEWICWVISVKRKETRQQHIERLISEITNGKRRPCCWAGCPHRHKGSV